MASTPTLWICSKCRSKSDHEAKLSEVETCTDCVSPLAYTIEVYTIMWVNSLARKTYSIGEQDGFYPLKQVTRFVSCMISSYRYDLKKHMKKEHKKKLHRKALEHQCFVWSEFVSVVDSIAPKSL